MPTFDELPRARRGAWIAIGAALLPWSWAINLWFVPSEVWRPLFDATGGLVYPTLVVGLPSVALYLLLARAGGLRPRHLGLEAARLPTGVLGTVTIWAALSLLAWPLADGPLGWGADWQTSSLRTGGRLLGQLLGNALVEEVVYRGFFFAQLLLALRDRGLGERRAALWAALASSLVFAVPHVPNRIMKDEYHGAADVLLDQSKLVVLGAFFCWIYLRTGNLFFVIGAHALGNYPSALVRWDFEAVPAEVAALLVAVAVTLGWRRRRDGEREARVGGPHA